jgi:hypothetical protein
MGPDTVPPRASPDAWAALYVLAVTVQPPFDDTDTQRLLADLCPMWTAGTHAELMTLLQWGHALVTGNMATWFGLLQCVVRAQQGTTLVSEAVLMALTRPREFSTPMAYAAVCQAGLLLAAAHDLVLVKTLIAHLLAGVNPLTPLPVALTSAWAVLPDAMAAYRAAVTSLMAAAPVAPPLSGSRPPPPPPLLPPLLPTPIQGGSRMTIAATKPSAISTTGTAIGRAPAPALVVEHTTTATAPAAPAATAAAAAAAATATATATVAAINAALPASAPSVCAFIGSPFMSAQDDIAVVCHVT